MPVAKVDTNEHYASFATTSRLVACLTSESLVPVHFVPASKGSTDNFIGLCLLLCPVKEENHVPTKVTVDSVLAVVPLRGLPIVDNSVVAEWNGVLCPRIDLVDSLDMLPHIYRVGATSQPNTSQDQVYETLKAVVSESNFNLVDGYDATSLWDRFAAEYGVDNKLIELISQELGSSIIFQSKFLFVLRA
jgi:hypothetical protein